jgi:hypothetical protein
MTADDPRPVRRGGPPEPSPEFRAKAREQVARLSEGGDLWQRAQDNDRRRRERRALEDELVLHSLRSELYWRKEHERLTRGGPVRRMLRALFT